jgi:peptidoglycan/xylan/chitin deacetylase (PgdA/CDA1 family)
MPLLSGFSIGRNASKLYFPIVESVRSVLPIVDEFVVALDRGDRDDDTEARLRALNDPKLRIVERKWDERLFADGSIFADETTFALQQCRSTWCLYLQADEVVHEDDLPAILEWCERYRDCPDVDGALFEYAHFWGDYRHHLDTHGICRREIRIVRNGIGAYSYRDALSFRKGANRKLQVVRIPARIYHYGYVRPPALQTVKKRVQEGIHEGREVSIAQASGGPERPYEYGPLGDIPEFTGTHPRVMNDFIARFNWRDQLDYGKRRPGDPVLHKHQRLKYRLLTAFERTFTGNHEVIGWKNYQLARPSSTSRQPEVPAPSARTSSAGPAYEIPVLMYHQVLRTKEQAGRFDTWVLQAALRRQLDYLARSGYETVTFRDLDRPARAEKKRIILTFDDGYEDNYTTLFPLLKQFGFTATIFMVTQLRSNEWAAAQGEPAAPLMTREQAREMAAYGVEFGGHTRTHVDVARVPPEVARSEIAGCKADLEEWLGVPVTSFAYPYGSTSEAAKQLVKEAGFRYAIATKSGPTVFLEDPYQIRRIAISYRTGMLAFRLKTSGHYHEPLNGVPSALRGRVA